MQLLIGRNGCCQYVPDWSEPIYVGREIPVVPRVGVADHQQRSRRRPEAMLSLRHVVRVRCGPCTVRGYVVRVGMARI
jgi:hypothetical protein